MKRRFLPAFSVLALSLATAPVTEASDSESPAAPVATVWIFTAVDCPIANAYAPEFNRLHEEYGSRGISLTLVYPEAPLREAEITAHLGDFALTLPFQHDHEHEIVKKCGVTTTPEVAIFDTRDVLVYRGKIDNLFSDFGSRRNTATETYLRDVLDQLLNGETVAFHETEPIGCYIENLPEN